MKFIQSAALDKIRWNALVASANAAVFSFSWYLDSCAQHWCVLVDETFENGIVLPFTIKMGVKVISPPIFVRNLDFIGNDPDFPQKAMEKIRQEFSAGHLQTIQALSNKPGMQENTKVRVFQAVSGENILNQQAKRMIQRATKNGISIAQTADWKSILEIIKLELTEKISEFNETNLQRLENLIASLSRENKLFCLGIYQDETLQGGMVFMENPEKRIYLKGASNRKSRDLGGMYLCMNEAIRQTSAENRTFDFGGSEVEGVRRFNLNLGGIDRHYYIYSWNTAPWWFNLTKRMYQKWKKK